MLFGPRAACTASAKYLAIGSCVSNDPGRDLDGRENWRQLPGSVQILHLAPVELPGPAVRRSVPVQLHSPLWTPTCSHALRRSKKMLWTICVILLVLWALGMATSYTAGGLIHVLLAVALVVVIFRLIQGRRILG